MLFNNRESLVKKQSKAQYEQMLAIVNSTHADRMLKIKSLQREMQQLLDYIANLLEAEENYLETLGLSAPSPINDDGTASRNPYSSLPDFGKNSRNEAIYRMINGDFTKESILSNNDGNIFGDAKVAVGIQEALDKLREEDAMVRFFYHKIRGAKLQVEMKREEVKKIQIELEAVAAGEDRENA